MSDSSDQGLSVVMTDDGETLTVSVEEAARRPVGSLVFVTFDERLWQLRAAEAESDAAVDALASWVTAEVPPGVQVLTRDTPPLAVGRSILERSGREVSVRKAYVTRSLVDPAPPALDARTRGWTPVPLAACGQARFLQRLTLCAQGDPQPVGEFAELVDAAGSLFDPEGWYLVDDADGPLGVVLPQAYPDVPTLGTLLYIGVLPERRGAGLGRELHQYGLQILAERGCTDYAGSTDLANVAMQRVFELNGCPVTHQQWRYDAVTSGT